MKRTKNEFDSLDEPSLIKKMIPVFAVIIIVAVLIVFLFIKYSQNKKTTTGNNTSKNPESSLSDENASADPENDIIPAETGMEVDIASILSTGNETSDTTYGIDVSKYQGTIDWAKVAASGIDFAMIRVGYRTQTDGTIYEDTNAKYNMQEATANGIKIGVYFFSTAISENEAKEEADWVSNYISSYKITYPVAYDSEGFNNSDSRQKSLGSAERTTIAKAFMDEIYSKGYTPMFYAAAGELTNNSEWITSDLQKSYKIWVAQYPDTSTTTSSYSGMHNMWQYTNRGNVDGISTTVDINVAYFGYNSTADSKSDMTPQTETANAEALMKFSSVNENVTAKESANLRDIPSQDIDSSILATLNNGDTATRTGISDSGWSRIIYNNQTYYAVSSYLTTDLSYVPSNTLEGAGSGDGLKTQFTDCNDSVTAKIEVNLRVLPSVTNPDAAVASVLKNGDTAKRTGINTEFGWARVEYNGQTLYCINSYLTSAE